MTKIFLLVSNPGLNNYDINPEYFFPIEKFKKYIKKIKNRFTDLEDGIVFRIHILIPDLEVDNNKTFFLTIYENELKLNKKNCTFEEIYKEIYEHATNLINN